MPVDPAIIAELSAKYRQGRSNASAPGVFEKGFKALNTKDLQRTLDADTLEAGGNGSLVKSIRFAGIDAPESSQALLGKNAQDWLDEQLKTAKKVEFGSTEKDKHGRQVSTVYADGRNLNVELVKQGHAQVYGRYLHRLAKPVREALLNAENEAREAKRGIWADDSGYEDSETYRARQQALLGDAAGALGHDKRPRANLDARTFGEFYKKFKGIPEHTGVSRGGPSDGSGNFEHQEGFLGSVLEGLDYAANASRSFLKGGNIANQRGQGLIDQARLGAKFASQALDKKRYTSSADLKDSFTKKWGIGKLRAGKDDGHFQMGDVLDFAGDLVLDVVTDPITYVTAGAGRVLRGGGELAKGLSEAKLGLKTPGAMKALKVQAGARAGIGAVYGLGSADPDADPLERIGAAAVGAGLGLAAGPAMETFGKAARAKFDRATNWYATTTRGSRFKDYATQKLVAMDAFDKKKNVAEWIRQGRLQALEGLSPAERLEATSVMQALKTETIKRRKAYELAGSIKDGTPEWNAMMQKVNAEIDQEVLPQILANQGERIGRSVKRWGEHNEKVMDKLNREVFGIAPEVRNAENAAGKGVVGIRFHIDDVYRKEDFEAAQKAMSEARVHKARSLGRSNAAAKLGPDNSYAIYSEEFSKNFLSKAEREAMDIVREYKETIPLQSGVAKLEGGLHKMDKLTNFIKANMLYFSMSWLKNNYFDNVAKAWVENGLGGMVDAATTGAFRKGLSRDVMDLYKGNVGRAYKSEHIMDALNLGVLDNPMFKSMTDELTRDFLFRPSDIMKANDSTIGNFVRKAGDAWFSKNPVIKVMSSTGSYMEGTARFTTYINALDSLRSAPAMKGVADRQLKQMAADLVKKTFFDYGDVSAFESAVFKRLVPFYSFYAKNLPYWAQATFDPARAARVVALDKVRRNIGRAPNDRDQAGMTPYIEGAAPRKLGKDKQGNQQYLIFPSTSMHDAIRTVNPKDWLKQFVEKSTPVPKAIVELMSGEDAFSGDKLYPGDQKGGKKYLYSRGFKWVAVKRSLEAMGFDSDSVFQAVAGTAGVDVDGNGNPYTKDGWTVVLDKVASTMLPHGFVDQVAGSVGKIGAGKESLDEAIFNRLAPMQNVKVSPAFARMVRQRRLKEDREARGK